MNFVDNSLTGHIDHSARVMSVITWNRSFKGIPHVDDGKDDFDSEDHETHATVLDKLLAWEKKLYDEVKVKYILPILFPPCYVPAYLCFTPEIYSSNLFILCCFLQFYDHK